MARRRISEDTTWKVKVIGRYIYTREDGRNDTKPYDVEVTLNKELVDKGPLSSFCKYIAPTLMPKKYPDYSRLATHTIAEMVCSDPNLVGDNLDVMSWHQLKDYLDYEGLEVNIDLYPDTGSLRQAIKDCEENEIAFLRTQEKLDKRIGPEIRLRKAGEQLNPEGVPSPVKTPEIQPVMTTQAVPKQKRLNASKDINEVEVDAGVPLEV